MARYTSTKGRGSTVRLAVIVSLWSLLLVTMLYGLTVRMLEGDYRSAYKIMLLLVVLLFFGAALIMNMTTP